MKAPSIQSLLLLTALLKPVLRAQETPAKIREIEQKVLQEQYQQGLTALIDSARDVESGSFGNASDILGKRVQWLAFVGGQIGEDDKIAVANRPDMSASASTLNDLAWNMITSPEAAARQPEIALKLANIAIELGSEDKVLKPKVLDTKARALLLLNKREEAIAEQEKAVAAATDPAERMGFEATLASYRKGELPLLSAPAQEHLDAESRQALQALQDLRAKMDQIVALQRQIEAAESEKEGSGPNLQLDAAKQELQRQKDDLERITRVKEAEIKRGPASGTPYLVNKLRNIVIPTVEFEDTSLEEAVDFLRKQSIELDTREPDPARKGVNFVLRVTAGGAATAADPSKAEGERGVIRIKELRLRNVPLAEVLRYICDTTRLRYKVDDFAVTLVSQGEREELFNRNFRVSPEFGTPLVPIQDLLKLCGVKFDDGASAKLLPSGTLVVRNTPTEIDKIETLIEADQAARAARKGTQQPVPTERLIER